LVRGRAGVSKVGPKLGIDSDPSELAVSSNAAVVADCQAVWVLRLPSAKRWSRIGTGCWGAASPDGRSIAFSPDGHQIMISSSDGGRIHRILDVHDLAQSIEPSSVPRIVGLPVWGGGGLAFLVRASDQLAVFVRKPDGRTVRAYQEEFVPTSPTPHLVWQPAGKLLAIADGMATSGPILRLFDPATSSLTALTFAPGGFAATTWSPDGSSIGLLTQPGQLIIVTLDGQWQLRRDVQWDNVLGWSEPA
jgi:Tol biopolymer transport system component